MSRGLGDVYKRQVYIVLPEDDVLVVADVFGVFGFAAEVVEPVLVFTELPPLTINCCPG